MRPHFIPVALQSSVVVPGWMSRSLDEEGQQSRVTFVKYTFVDEAKYTNPSTETGGRKIMLYKSLTV